LKVFVIDLVLALFFGMLAHNGKSIGEVRAFEELKVQEKLNGADAFSMQ